MRRFGTLGMYVCALALVVTVGAMSILYSQPPTQAPSGFTTHKTSRLGTSGGGTSASTFPDAPTGYTTPTMSDHGAQSTGNGYSDSRSTLAADQEAFEEAEGVDEGIGPIFNARGCAECHQNPVTGGGSQVTELRVGHNNSSGIFVNPTITINNGQTTIPNRSLINDRAVCPEAQERVPGTETIRAQRASLSVLGDGFVEAIDANTLLAIAQKQPGQTGGRIAGQFIQVPVLESPGQVRGGRFGWKNQQASLLSFAADAYLNESGVTSRLLPTEFTSVCDGDPNDPEDRPDPANGMDDLDHFTAFMRATNAPPIDPVQMATTSAQNGQRLFNAIGCAVCHVTSITTAPPGTVINGGAFTVPAALGNKVIHPYSDFLLHNVGTGDGIVQNGPNNTANKMRTAPLWGLRTRPRLMHDLQSFTRNDAVLRHGGEATFVINNYRSLSISQKNDLINFLNAL
jgi:CxxC motif-containing protein (DUF1111 family)